MLKGDSPKFLAKIKVSQSPFGTHNPWFGSLKTLLTIERFPTHDLKDVVSDLLSHGDSHFPNHLNRCEAQLRKRTV